MIITLLGLAIAAPPGFKVSKTTTHCELSLGAPLGNGVVPMRAECHWADIAPEKVHALMAAWADHDLYFSAVSASDVLRTDGSRVWVHQVHVAKGISDREAILVMEKKPIPGGFRYGWTLDNAGLTVATDRVAAAWDDGFWEVSAHPQGGTLAVHQLAYDPGGSVPSFLVRWFQTSGLTAVVEELEAWARK